jgi:rod shape-determining protein MreC
MVSVPIRMIGMRATPVALVLLSLSLMFIHRMDVLPVEKLRAAAGDVAAPVLETVSRPFVRFADSFDALRSMRALKAENMSLKADNERLKQWYEAALKYQAENKSLHDLLNVKADPQISFVTTRVVADPGGAFVKSVLLPAGKNDGVKNGSAVMAGQGLIGRVTEMGARSSRVLLVSDLNSRIPVLIQNTRTKAILAGKNGELLRLERLPADSGLTVGSRVVTSGDGGLLPPDIPIGTIVSAGPDGAFVKPLADLDNVTWVQVVSANIDGSLSTGDIARVPGE